MSEDRRILDLRQELAELRDPGPQDPQGYALYQSIRQSLVNDLAELGATPEPPAAPARRPIPFQIHRASSKPIPQEVRHAVSPGKAGAPGAASQPEEPMPQPAPAEPTAAPQELLDMLLLKLVNATGEAATAPDKKAFLQARGRVYQHRNEIAKLVKAHGLAEPSLPGIPVNPWARGSIRPAASPSGQDAPPPALGGTVPATSEGRHAA